MASAVANPQKVPQKGIDTEAKVYKIRITLTSTNVKSIEKVRRIKLVTLLTPPWRSFLASLNLHKFVLFLAVPAGLFGII